MAGTSQHEIKLFYCYARKDKPLRDELEKHLAWLKHRYHLTNWHDRELLPGEEWEQAIDTHLNTAHLILLLISPDFIASDYCYGKEMQRALERHQAGTCRVIPILLRPTYWEGAPFSHLQLLPTDARAITRWPDRDEAFEDVVAEINRTIKDLLNALKTKEEWLQEGAALRDLKRHQEELAAYEQVIRLDPNFALAYINKGNALRYLKRSQEALGAFEQAIHLNPNDALAYHGKGAALYDLKRSQEALGAFEQAIHLNPNFAAAYYGIGTALNDLKRHQEALIAFEQAIRLDPNYVAAYNNMGIALCDLKRSQEALSALEQAIRLDPNYAAAYNNKGLALESLGKEKEARQAYEKARQLVDSTSP
jgi:tetratricopeptide (TPR) repeat protein